MDSLLANYASSDEEEEQQQQDEDPKPSFPLFSSLPPPKSSLFSSLPPPKSQTLAHVSPPNPNSPIEEQKFDKPSLFSSLPPPKSDPSNPNSQIQEQKLDKPSSLFASLPKPTSSSQFSLLPPPNPKKVVQIKLPVMKPSSFDDNDDDDDIEREGRKTESISQAPSVKSFLSSIPAPKNSTSTLGALPSALGSGRKSILEANVPSSNSSSFVADTQSGVNSNETNYGRSSSISTEYGVSGGGDDASSVNYDSYDGNAVYGSYDNYGNYDYNCNWGGGSAEVAQSSMVGVGESVMKVPGKRGRNEIPQEIVEVTQDELTKNRPREDQVKMTGIAFGPAYQDKGNPNYIEVERPCLE